MTNGVRILSSRLNEGFATLFEYQLTGLLYPQWRLRDFFNTRKLQNALRSDSQLNTRPMTKQVITNGEIFSAFNYVSYDKGKIKTVKFEYFLKTDQF